jgi:crossover junction endodeoxyribonuclease RusA
VQGRVRVPQADSQAAAALPAEPAHTTRPDEGRRWRIELPAGMQLLNSNDRPHWSARARITKNLRWTTFYAARRKKIPPMQRVHVLAEYEPPDRRRRDPGNLYPSIKACVDGLVDAKVCPDDDASHLVGPDMRLSEDTFPLGRLVLVITELLNPSENPS